MGTGGLMGTVCLGLKWMRHRSGSERRTLRGFRIEGRARLRRGFGSYPEGITSISRGSSEAITSGRTR